MSTIYPTLHEVFQKYELSKRTNPELRLGQFFCNEYDYENSDLFYTTNQIHAVRIINEILHASSNKV